MRVKIVEDLFEEGILGLKVNVCDIDKSQRPHVYFVRLSEFPDNAKPAPLAGEPDLVAFYGFEVKEVIVCANH